MNQINQMLEKLTSAVPKPAPLADNVKSTNSEPIQRRATKKYKHFQSLTGSGDAESHAAHEHD